MNTCSSLPQHPWDMHHVCVWAPLPLVVTPSPPKVVSKAHGWLNLVTLRKPYSRYWGEPRYCLDVDVLAPLADVTLETVYLQPVGDDRRIKLLLILRLPRAASGLYNLPDMCACRQLQAHGMLVCWLGCVAWGLLGNCPRQLVMLAVHVRKLSIGPKSGSVITMQALHFAQ
jgi:hypothetical protein